MKLFWKRIFPVCVMLAMLVSLSLPCFAAGEKGAAEIVSHGLSVLSAKTDVALSSMVGNDIVFSADAIAKGLNLSSVRYVTVQSVPSVADGELLLGSSKVVAGQSISADQLSSMVFHPAGDQIRFSNFRFTANGSGTPIICSLYLLDEKNVTPTVSMASGLMLQLHTYRDMAAHGLLSAYDADGDSLRFEIVSYPQNGSLRLNDAEEGSYVYTPREGYIGSDAFNYVARDLYGNYSASATVSLQIELSGTSVTYVDMQNSAAYAAALRLTEQGIMSGTRVGAQSYFYPEQTLTRVDFLVMAMHAAGIREVPACAATAFADDADIPASMKGYVSAAYSLGYIGGSEVNGKLCFLPNEKLSRAEAAVMLEKILGLEDARIIPTFEDHSEIPVWAADAIYSLHAVGILLPTDGCVAAEQPLTREQAALWLSAVTAYRK